MYHIKNCKYLKEVSNIIYLYSVSINELHLFIRNAYLCTSDILELICTSFSANSLGVNSMFIMELSLQIHLRRFRATFLSIDMLLRCEPKVLQVTHVFIRLH